MTSPTKKTNFSN